jgi:predicted permease
MSATSARWWIPTVLVAGSLLFARSFSRLADVDPGFRPEPILRVSLDLRALGAPPEQLLTSFAQVADRLRAVPGVAAVGYSDIVPMTGSGWNQRVRVDGELKAGTVFVNRVSPGYFDAMQTPIVAGRDFRAHDTASAPLVALVNEQFAAGYLRPEPPVGQRFRFQVGPQEADLEFEIVGVVPNTKYYELREDFLPIVYLAAGQDDRPLPYQQLLLRASGTASSLRAPVTRAVAEIHPSILVTFTEYGAEVRNSLLRERLMAALSGGFAVLAIVLAAVGLYGLMAYAVARRRQEIGIRAALGATRGRLARMIVTETAILAADGVGVGVALAVAAGRTAHTL